MASKKVASTAANSQTSKTKRRNAALSFRRRKLMLHRLPFIGPTHNGFSFWAVPATGGYAGGCRTGEALAALYLRHLRGHGDANGPGSLQRIVLDMMGKDCHNDALRGQVVGFFATLDSWLVAATKHMGRNLDTLDIRGTLAQANAGLIDDEAP